jgi:hypothetical protein
MHTQFKLQIEIVDTQVPDGAEGILVPMPPTTPHQQLKKLVFDPTWSTSVVKSQSGVQSAIFAAVTNRAQLAPIEMHMVDSGVLDNTHFTDAVCKNGIAQQDALQLAGELELSLCCNEMEQLDAIVDSLANKFQYQSGYTNDAPLTCDLLTGNCLSINDAFLKMTQVADIPSVYYIGYFFQSEQPLNSKDWHCWVSTLTTRGYENWDIAHHLKRGLRDIQPGLNPVPGIRFATSVGRDLVFRLPFADVSVPHLCEPRWVFKDGASKKCEVRVSLAKLADVPEAESFDELTDMALAQREAAISKISNFNFLKALAVQ